MKQILRWILVLPASVLAAFLVYWVNVNALSQFYVNTGSETGTPFLIDICATVLSSGAFVSTGTSIAPKYRKETAIVLAVLISILCGISITFAFINSVGWECTKYVLYGISGIIASVATCFYFIRNEIED